MPEQSTNLSEEHAEAAAPQTVDCFEAWLDAKYPNPQDQVSFRHFGVVRGKEVALPEDMPIPQSQR